MTSLLIQIGYGPSCGLARTMLELYWDVLQRLLAMATEIMLLIVLIVLMILLDGATRIKREDR
jgi:hypothetical protein